MSLQAFEAVHFRSTFFWDVLNNGCMMPDILRPCSGLSDSQMSGEDTGHLNVEDDATAWVRNGEQQISRNRPKYPRRVTAKLMMYMPNSVNKGKAVPLQA